MPRRALYGGLLLLLAAVLLLGAVRWQRARPRVYDNDGTEVIYRDQGVDYQVCLAFDGDPFTPAGRARHNGAAPLDQMLRYPVILYANLTDGETFAAEEFLEKVDHIAGEVAVSDQNFQVTCSEAVRNTDYVPGSAAILYIDSMITALGEHEAELTVSITMKNGDILRLHQT